MAKILGNLARQDIKTKNLEQHNAIQHRLADEEGKTGMLAFADTGSFGFGEGDGAGGDLRILYAGAKKNVKIEKNPTMERSKKKTVKKIDGILVSNLKKEVNDFIKKKGFK